MHSDGNDLKACVQSVNYASALPVLLELQLAQAKTVTYGPNNFQVHSYRTKKIV